MTKYLQLVAAVLILASCGGAAPKKDHPSYHLPATQALTDSIAAQPGNPDFYYKRAEALSRMQLDSLALADVLKARELAPGNAQYTYTEGYLLLQTGQTAAAVKTLLHHLEQVPGNVSTRLLLSRAYIASDNTAAAQEQVSKVLAAAPRHPGALMMQADIMVARKDTAGAEAVLRELLLADPQNYDAAYQLADWYRASGKPEAIAQYRRTFALDTTDVSPLYEIGVLYEQQQQWQAAKDAYKVCIGRDMDFTDAYIRTGNILLRQDSVDKALRHFKMAINTMPDNAEAYAGKGACFEKLSQRDSAVAAYRQALLFDGGRQEAVEGLKRLKK